MNETQSLYDLLVNLWRHISTRRRRQLLLLLMLMLVSAFAEIMSIGAILPFLAALASPTKVFQLPILRPFIELLEIKNPDEILLPLTIVFGGAALIAGFFRLLFLWVSTRLSFAIGADLGSAIYIKTLYQSYGIHCARNSSEVIDGISTKANTVIYGVIIPVLTLFSSVIMLSVILAALLSLEPFITLIVFLGFGLIYGLIISLTRKRVLRDGQMIAKNSSKVIKCIQEGLGGIRDVLIDNTQQYYYQIYRNADLVLRRAQGSQYFLTVSPRYAMEALGMVLIACITIIYTKDADGLVKALPTLGVLALSAQRLLPVLQHAYGSWINIKGSQASLRDAITFLDQPLPYQADIATLKPIAFKNEISLHDISFRYSQGAPWVIKNLNLTIKKGTRIGFIGASGSGKSTLIDILMGLLMPNHGELKVDGSLVKLSNMQSWQSHIAHVPQNIFLADSTIIENIALGVPKNLIDLDRVMRSAEQAKLSEAIESWEKKYQTVVGEGGIRISGGQRQRIGIARALYKKAEVIVFDEATSALDGDTELEVMQAIEALNGDLTILIVAHRISTLKNCSQIIELGNQGIKRISTYQDLIKSTGIL